MRTSGVHVRSSIKHFSNLSTRANIFLFMVRNWRLFLCPQLVPWIINDRSFDAELELRGRVGLEPRPDATVMALIHAPGTFSGGLTRTLMMAGRHSYVLYAYQVGHPAPPLNNAALHPRHVNRTRERGVA